MNCPFPLAGNAFRRVTSTATHRPRVGWTTVGLDHTQGRQRDPLPRTRFPGAFRALGVSVSPTNPTRQRGFEQLPR